MRKSSNTAAHYIFHDYSHLTSMPIYLIQLTNPQKYNKDQYFQIISLIKVGKKSIRFLVKHLKTHYNTSKRK